MQVLVLQPPLLPLLLLLPLGMERLGKVDVRTFALCKVRAGVAAPPCASNPLLVSPSRYFPHIRNFLSIRTPLH